MLQFASADVSHHPHPIVWVARILPQDRETTVMSPRANKCKQFLSQTLYSVFVFNLDSRDVAGYLKGRKQVSRHK